MVWTHNRDYKMNDSLNIVYTINQQVEERGRKIEKER
jgi:hypothetical protein